MAVVVTIANGYDLGYIWKTQDHTARRTTGGYYIDAAQAGEPPGRWWGPGAQALGLTPGQTVHRAPYDAVYRQTDPRTGTRLGRPRGRYPTFADHLARLQAAEPHATAERLIELEREAARATRQPAAYYDVTVSFSKSISVLHASIRENERRARVGGDQQAAAYWAGREQQFQEVLHRANRAALEYLQAWAGITRTGYHGTRIDGREPGRFEPAGLIVTSWLQGTSRDGDPQDHIHNQIARITRTYRDGKWRALDTMSVRAVLGALQAVAATAVECELTREFGVDWIPRADGRGNEIKGISRAQGLSHDRVGEQRIPVGWAAVGGQDQRASGPLGDQLIQVVGLGGGELAHAEVVQDQHGGAGELTEPLVPGQVGAAAGQMGEHAAGLEEPGLGARADGEVPERLRDMGLADPDQIGDRLQHLRGALPCAIRVTGAGHPLRGRMLDAVSFMHLRGVLHLVVMLPDSSPGTIPASATDIFGVAAAAGPAVVLDAGGLRRLRALVTALAAGEGRAR